MLEPGACPIASPGGEMLLQTEWAVLQRRKIQDQFLGWAATRNRMWRAKCVEARPSHPASSAQGTACQHHPQFTGGARIASGR